MFIDFPYRAKYQILFYKRYKHAYVLHSSENFGIL